MKLVVVVSPKGRDGHGPEAWGRRYNGSSDSTQLYTDVIRIPMILRCTLVQ